jgi:hypothetical protein
MVDVEARTQFGEGPLSRIAAFVYTLFVIEVLLLVTSVPGLVPLLLLERDASNLPIAALCLVPFGPALSAAVYALRHRKLDLTELKPARAFWRGYRLNVGGALRIWLPWLVWVTIVGVGLANFAAAGLPGWWAALLVIVAVVSTLWVANALVITSLFAFRAVDIARLAAYFLGRALGTTLGNACLVIVAVGVTYISSELVLLLLGSIFALALLRTSEPMITEVRDRFTA